MGSGLLGTISGGLFGSAESPDYAAAADRQYWGVRPDQNNPFGSMSWEQGPDGHWTQNMSFSPEMQGIYASLIDQLRGNIGKGIGTGDDAFKKSFGSSWANAQANLLPQLQQNYDRGYSNLVNQGIDVGNKAAFGTAMQDLQGALNAGATGAWDAAMKQGLAGQSLTYAQNKDAYMAPFSALGQMRDLASPFGFQSGNYQQAAADQGAFNLGRQKLGLDASKMGGDLFNGVTKADWGNLFAFPKG